MDQICTIANTSTNDQTHHINKHRHTQSLRNSPTHLRPSEIIDFYHHIALLFQVTWPPKVTSVLCMSLTCGGLRDWLHVSGMWRSREKPVHKFLSSSQLHCTHNSETLRIFQYIHVQVNSAVINPERSSCQICSVGMNMKSVFKSFPISVCTHLLKPSVRLR